MEQFDVVIIGAGPSGSVSASLLKKQGLNVCVLEKQHFPRFVIGESLLPYCMEILKEAELVEAVNKEPSFQFKNGAAFTWGNRYTHFDFTDKFTAGAGTTFQVRRDKFDKILIDETIKKGVDVRFGDELINFNNDGEVALLDVKKESGEQYQLQAKFVLDASGYGRVLPRLLDLELPSHLPARIAKFTHIDDNITDPQFDRNKILITTHPTYRDVWIWLIPFADNRCSIGVVGLPEILEGDCETVLKQFVFECPMLKRILSNANWDNDVPYREICGYSANVKALYGKQFALLGNAAEFLDPVFSSGVTIALHSAHLACHLVTRQLNGEAVNWQQEFADPLMIGVNAFRTYVLGWYDYSFQDVIYARNPQPEIRQMISSILAGYAWDTENPLVNKSTQRLAALAGLCGTATQDE
ncbi:NAD(P)/FAD-dependent oxidoreductase [Pasteurella atlantica]|uniref:NAD(P)/FAD-dependent oxidoreductase n=2 Tax=Pasteurellaceae TaxID=712 RepID=A0ACC6HK13_9PAST|nr:NAD(P)/FAD-dependent oxidoreductase [Pasteurella atlantica]MDP8051222.1 NAD(P)/FAD-dependent oxidoreductase [Pasteurella atlantica]MDP8098903.1 NAD(P)/FAD-dependent oxidoreductase [Pasteurella atlantica]MDP8104517.1 NAD(P)/FAD-dependent oxidoreductase [Pasteurella atlantica]MDP8106930.1 NAD(P)/FAD-dependent oxidoreductase [Pasteurella atlantica]MDP8116620.1 NAD(P)/FAD-dependent oxidoreductase [Pasteurella atlantica]